MSIAIVSGALANKYRNGGGAWERLSWATGLRRLGFDVYFVEQIASTACANRDGHRTSREESINLGWFNSVVRWFGFEDRAALIYGNGGECAGMSWSSLLDVARSAELLINLSGHLTIPELLEKIARTAYIDVDPGFTQFWLEEPNTAFQIPEHDFYFTIGENIGRPECQIPAAGKMWRPTRQPVVLDDWPMIQTPASKRFTTIASWRGPYGPICVNGNVLGIKAHEFRKVIELPRRGRVEFEIALDIHPSDRKDLAALMHNGWHIVDPISMADTPQKFRRYVQESAAEFSVAQGVYVGTNSGWFSDRSVRYLASGKPVLVQDTGFGRNLPVGEGLLAFRTLDDAVAAVEQILTNYERHCTAARDLAEAYFDSDKVLGSLIESMDGVRAA